jgi:hypothetical protein
MKVSVFSVKGGYIPQQVTDLQEKVIRKFLPDDWHFESVPMCGRVPGIHHGMTAENYIKDTDYDAYILMDNDCIPLTEHVFPFYFHYMIQGKIIGCVQRANHIENNEHVYAGPMMLGFTKELYERLDSPTLGPTHRGDTAEELTYVAEKAGVEVKLLWPSHYEEKRWTLINNKWFGIGTTYEDMVYHAFEISKVKAQELFYAKCNEILK